MSPSDQQEWSETSPRSGWFVSISTERTIWQGPAELPEVEPLDVTELFSASEEASAREFARNWCAGEGLEVTHRADIRPIEACGACGGDMDTREPHQAVILEKASGTPSDWCVEHLEYVSRRCTECAKKAA